MQYHWIQWILFSSKIPSNTIRYHHNPVCYPRCYIHLRWRFCNKIIHRNDFRRWLVWTDKWMKNCKYILCIKMKQRYYYSFILLCLMRLEMKGSWLKRSLCLYSVFSIQYQYSVFVFSRNNMSKTDVAPWCYKFKWSVECDFESVCIQ